MVYDPSEERMRKAYLALMTGFMMKSGLGERDKPLLESRSGRGRELYKAETVRYMVSPAGKGKLDPSKDAMTAYKKINPGMEEKELGKVMEGVVLETGRSVSEEGVLRYYFRIGSNCQFWVEVGDGACVQSKGALEPKCEWRRFSGNVIEIPEKGLSECGSDEKK